MNCLYGWWNEQLRSDPAFVTALKHIAGANVLAMSAILEVRADAIFIQSESATGIARAQCLFAGADCDAQ